ncbi:MAG TPA: hypothetical protein VMV46_06515 [Thermoanaerobaculia bacterium]|nr:hypothetical protein [Thermoanaerobaculia bacterium]
MYQSAIDLDRLSDDQLVAAFATGRIGPEAFRHRHHVRVAYLYLRRYSLGSAIDLLRRDLLRFASRHGRPGLYHETLTLGYLLLVHERMADAPATWSAFAEANPDLLTHRGGAFQRLYAGIDLENDSARRWFRLPGPSAAPPCAAEAFAQRAI